MDIEAQGLSRRSFVQGMAAGSLGLAAAGALVGCGSSASAAGMPDRWDQEADVVVIGFGAAGYAAAIEAAGSGASVLILEKMPLEQAGGASSCFGGIMTAVSKETIVNDSHGRYTEEDASAISAEATAQVASVKKLGVPFREDFVFLVQGGGKVVYDALVKSMSGVTGVTVAYSSPAKSLVQDGATREVRGVLAERDGQEIYVKANKAVIITSGGYIANNDLTDLFHYPGLKTLTVGSPADTGDGLIMGLAAGAALNTMGKSYDWFEFAFRAISEEYGTGITCRQWTTADLMLGTDSSPLHDSRIFVNLDGQRFMNEKYVLTHDKGQLPFLDFSGAVFAAKKEWLNVPAFYVCDDTCIKSGPLGKAEADKDWTWAVTQGIYEWSDDNSAEIEAGWLIKADTLEELAAKMTAKTYWGGEDRTVDAAALKATVERYNADCAAGVDPYGRTAEKLKPIETPPFYAAELCPCGVYNVGGLKTNARSQTLDANDEPIPRLYSAGNVGHGTYLSPLGVPGVMARGALAARDAVALEAWE